MHLANSLIKVLSALIAIDFLIGYLGRISGLDYLENNAELYITLWLPLIFFLSGIWLGLRGAIQKINLTHSGALLRTINILGDSPIFFLILLAPILAYIIGNPVIATIRGNAYSDLIGNVQGAGPLMVMFGLLATLSSLRIMKLLIINKHLSWSRALLTTSAIVWVLGPRKAALFSVFAPIIIYLWLNEKSKTKSKIKIIFIAFTALSISPLIDIYRYGNEADSMQFIIQLAGGLAPNSSVAPQTLNYAGQTSCEPNKEAILGNIYYFIPRMLWEDKPPILPNSNYFVTTEVLGLDDSLSISGGLLSESLILTCVTAPTILSILLFLKGLIIGLISGFFIKTFLGALGFWTIIVPMQFAMLREGIGLYLKDIITASLLLLFIHGIVRLAKKTYNPKSEPSKSTLHSDERSP